MIISKRRQRKSWMNSELRKVINKNKRALKQYRARDDFSSLSKLKEIGETLKRTITSSRTNYFSTLDVILKQNPTEFWKFIRSNRKEIVGIQPLTVSNSPIADKLKASSFHLSASYKGYGCCDRFDVGTSVWLSW